MKINGNDIVKLGFEGRMIGLILEELESQNFKMAKKNIFRTLRQILKSPDKFKTDAKFGKIATTYYDLTHVKDDTVYLMGKEKPFTMYGEDGIEWGAKNQMIIASKLPVTVQGSLMPDAHQGYGLPIGGVLATENAVIPYGVGVDIGCRMSLTLYPENPSIIKGQHDRFEKELLKHTAFGMGSVPDKVLDDAVLENKLFNEIKFVKGLKDVAARQIGSSGGGNHFVEWGSVEIFEDSELGIDAGNYLALLTHSGSRGLGAQIAKYYTTMAKEQCRLEKHASHLAYLDMNTEAGQEYWLAMNLAGDYAKACHDHIHRKLQRAMGVKEILKIENHHNFAWKEKLHGKDVIVHRKGATPAHEGVLGIIPGSMSSPGYIVRGKGHEDSINSASHGAGRLMSRRQGNDTFTMSDVKKILDAKDITLIGAGPDEAPGVYKDIETVMSNQTHLVDKLGKFYPKIVRMAD
jgi:tRNA-splicing ligase RtcB